MKVFFRGAPDMLLDECEYVWVRGQPRRLGREERRRLAVQLDSLCGEGLRVLGFATATTAAAAVGAAGKGGDTSLSSSLLPSAAITGFLAFEDPVRASVAEAIHTCRDAGIRVVMLTGDHQLTACSVARQVGILPPLSPSLPPSSSGKGGKGKKIRRPISSVSAYQSVEEGGMGSEAGTEAGTEGGREEQFVVVCPDTPGWQADAKLLEHGAVFCRASPDEKLALLRALQREGGREGGRGGRHVVAVTGDGANDALTLAAADVGLAMGRYVGREGRRAKRGVVVPLHVCMCVWKFAQRHLFFSSTSTSFSLPPIPRPRSVDQAKAAAGIVVAHEDFPALLHTLREGRRLFSNFRKALAFYLGAKSALLLLFLLAPLPLSPLQIILLELFMDVGASTTFTLEPADGDLMLMPPRHPSLPFFDDELLQATLAGGVSLLLVVLLSGGAPGWHGGREGGREDAAEYRQSLYFYGWLLGHVFLALHLRSFHQPLVVKGVFSNPAFLVWAGAVLLLILLLALLPPLGQVLGLVGLPPREWLRLSLLALVGTGWMEGWKVGRWYGAGGSHAKETAIMVRRRKGREEREESDRTAVVRKGAARIVAAAEVGGLTMATEKDRLLG